MREIKFRAWDKEGNKMFKVQDIRFPYFECEESVHDTFGAVYLDEEYELMQYTGLKDKNGVEIYEGDIFKTSSMKYEIRFEAPVFRAFFGNAAFCINNESGEVIGNIYENPELLEVS